MRMAGLRVGRALLTGLLLAAVFWCADSEDIGGSVNKAAALRLKNKLEWKEAQPEGCKLVGDGDGEGQKGRWCELHDDGSLTLRNAKRLQKGLDAIAARRDKEGAEFVESGTDIAAVRVMEARGAADKVFMLKEKKRRLEWKESQKKKGKGATNDKPPAVRQPAKYFAAGRRRSACRG